jgi:hypothetical protein
MLKDEDLTHIPAPIADTPATTPKKNPWRPTKYRPQYCREIVEICAQGHLSVALLER